MAVNIATSYHVNVLRSDGTRTKYVRYGDEAEVRRRIIQEGASIISLKKVREFHFFKTPVTVKETYLILDTMSKLLRGGMSLSKSLETLVDSLNEKQQIKDVLRDIHIRIIEGMPLSQAMGKFPKIFPHNILALIFAAESTGEYENSLKKAADYLHDYDKSKAAFLKSIRYPAVIFCVGIGVLIFTTQYTIPKIINSDIFKNIPKDSTNAIPMIALKFLSTAVLPGLGFSVVGFVLFYLFYKSNQERAEKILFKIPYLKQFIFYRGYYIAFTSLASLLESGMPLEDSLKIIVKSSESISVQREFESALQELHKGNNFAEGLRNIENIEKALLLNARRDDMFTSLTTVSERFYDQYMRVVEGLGAKLYTLLVIFVALLVLFIFAGIYMPYSEVINGIINK